MTTFKIVSFIAFLMVATSASAQRTRTEFNTNWKFLSGDDRQAKEVAYDDSRWRTLNLPHDWSIEGSFSDKYPTTYNQAALPAGIGWYRKTFTLPQTANRVYITFDGIYRNSEVWINGHYLGKRPNGYISFRYELTPYLNHDNRKNVLAVKVDNSEQPDSRWYTGSGIYRNVWLVTTNNIAVDHWGTFVTTPEVTAGAVKVRIDAVILNGNRKEDKVSIETTIYNQSGKSITRKMVSGILLRDSLTSTSTELTVANPVLWSVDHPYLYKAVTKIISSNKVTDEYETTFGVRAFHFDAVNGFFLNGKGLKILGVCNHHDLGALGAAVNVRAIERQLEILKVMGCNAIRTAHNPPAPELLDLCDKMGFIVMDEAFDMWKKRKNKADYHLDFEQWHQRDLEDMVKRDRNHPSVFIWSIGNEIREQFDSTGITITKDLVRIVKNLDTTRPVTSALTENISEKNFIYQSNALDLLGFNYKIDAYPELPKRFPGQKFIASETMSALATRGHYDLPSDSIRLWPPGSKIPFKGNPDLTVSAYDHAYAYWGTTHEQGWKAVKNAPFLSGLYVWAGFDFLGEPVPYSWPARSSYYGIIDLAGFPKDVYYLYQSEWTNKPVLHLFPHWNWKPGQIVDVWAYYSGADEVELYLNGKSLGVKKKIGDDLHIAWKVPFQPGTLKAVSRLQGKPVLIREIKTAGKPAKIQLTADRKVIKADGKDLSFVTVKITDDAGNLVPDADHLVNFTMKGRGFIAGVDNGYQASMEPFKANFRKAYNGLCLAIIGSTEKGAIVVEATASGLLPNAISISSN